MTAFEGARDMDMPARPSFPLAARRLVAMAIGIVVGAEFALLLWLVVP